jgi:uncharacterized damage-inducible protein DinB
MSRDNSAVIPTEQLREHWQGHRRVTRRVIDAFPEKELFTYSVGGMRPGVALALEMIGMASAGVEGLATRKWDKEIYASIPKPTTRAELLQLWDEVTAKIDRLWPEIPAGRFEEIDMAFGQWEGQVFGLFQYWVDNEIHHRGQAYVYLRALGIEPPAFYDRG